MDYPLQTLDGATTSYRGIANIEAVLNNPLALDQFGNKPYGARITLPDGRRFTYCYTALATILYGGCVCIDYTGVATSGKNPNATIPTQNTTIYHTFGIAAETAAVAGGVWVQTYGRCAYARVDGGTNDAGLAGFLHPVTTCQYLIYDHTSVATTNAMAIFERCRQGVAGTTKWGSAWETVAAFPWYDIAQTLALNAQYDTIYADPCCQVFLTGNRAIIT